jgi:uncharacterized protein (DUF433 family)
VRVRTCRFDAFCDAKFGRGIARDLPFHAGEDLHQLSPRRRCRDARGIRDGLAAKFGRGSVFMDVDDLLAGQRFDEDVGWGGMIAFSRFLASSFQSRRCWRSLCPTSRGPSMDHPRIQSDPKVMMGKPVIRGTRITVENILRCLAAGDSVEQLLSDYPRLTVDDIRAAQAFAADHLAHESVFAAE